MTWNAPFSCLCCPSAGITGMLLLPAGSRRAQDTKLKETLVYLGVTSLLGPDTECSIGQYRQTETTQTWRIHTAAVDEGWGQGHSEFLYLRRNNCRGWLVDSCSCGTEKNRQQLSQLPTRQSHTSKESSLRAYSEPPGEVFIPLGLNCGNCKLLNPPVDFELVCQFTDL